MRMRPFGLSATSVNSSKGAEPAVTEFKIGDRVNIMIGTGDYHQDREVGVVKRVDGPGIIRGYILVLENGRWGYAENARLVDETPVRPLVGPAPKVAPPVLQAPFEFRHGFIYDSTKKMVLEVLNGASTDNGLTEDQADEFGEFIRDVLNTRVFSEE